MGATWATKKLVSEISDSVSACRGRHHTMSPNQVKDTQLQKLVFMEDTARMG
jgi:hypothetical protein